MTKVRWERHADYPASVWRAAGRVGQEPTGPLGEEERWSGNDEAHQQTSPLSFITRADICAYIYRTTLRQI